MAQPLKAEIGGTQTALLRRLRSVTGTHDALGNGRESTIVDSAEMALYWGQNMNDFAGLHWEDSAALEGAGRILTSFGVGMGIGNVAVGFRNGDMAQLDQGVSNLGQVAANYGASRVFEHVATPQRRFVNFSLGRLPISSGARFLAKRGNGVVLVGGAIIDLTALNIELRQEAGSNLHAVNDMHAWGAQTIAWKGKLNQLKAEYAAKGCQ